MAFGILDCESNAQPVGTTLLENIQDSNYRKLQAEVILVPQPTNYPSGPLNLSRIRKELLFLTIILSACATGVIGPLLVPGFPIIAAAFQITLTQVTLLNGSLVMALGVSSYVCSILATMYGKRLIFLVTSLILVATCCWGAAAQSYNSLLAARVFQGLGMGGFFALAGTGSINDVFFVHERGSRIGLWNFAVIVSVNMTPLISGYVITNLGWRWSFWLLALTFGVLFRMVVAFFPETTFDHQTVDSSTLTNASTEEAALENTNIGSEKASLKLVAGNSTVLDSDIGISKPVLSQLLRILGLPSLPIKHHTLPQFLHLLITPFLILRHPTILWSCAMWSVTFTWVIIQGAIGSQIFTAPPYNMSTTSVGNLLGVAPLIGAAIGTLVGGWACDFLGRKMAIRNNGVYEPEFRLWVMVPFLVAVVIGSFGLGIAIEKGLSAIISGIFLAILNFAVGMGCTGIVTYSNDVCLHRAGEAFGITMLIKSAFAFGLTFMLNDYYARNGLRVFFFTWGGLTIGVTMLTFLLYVFGKRIRAWGESSNVL